MSGVRVADVNKHRQGGFAGVDSHLQGGPFERIFDLDDLPQFPVDFPGIQG